LILPNENKGTFFLPFYEIMRQNIIASWLRQKQGSKTIGLLALLF
jgi:hypothetical protein